MEISGKREGWVLGKKRKIRSSGIEPLAAVVVTEVKVENMRRVLRGS